MKQDKQKQSTLTHAIVGTLTAKTGPHTESYSGLCGPDPRGSHVCNGWMDA
jgi:hypothetical protein